MDNFALIIPSYRPNDKFPAFVEQLMEHNFRNIIIINDGSGESYARIFQELQQAKIINHKENRGKGAALKSGYRYVLENLPWVEYVVTCDDDGQHRTEDIVQITNFAMENKLSCVIGSRTINRKIPLRSFLGNSIINLMLTYVSKYKVLDSQSGLRCLQVKLLTELLKVKNDRFDFETIALLVILKQKPIFFKQVATIYNDNNFSRFRTFSDSVLVVYSLLKWLISRDDLIEKN